MKKYLQKINIKSGWIIIPLLIIGYYALMFIFQYSSEGNIIAKEIIKALKYLFVSFVILQIYNISKEKVNIMGFKKILWEGLLWCAGIAFIFSINLGSPTCIDSEQDTRGNVCLEYADNGYEPSSQERYAEFIFFLILFYIPTIIGARDGNKNNKLSSYEE